MQLSEIVFTFAALLLSPFYKSDTLSHETDFTVTVLDQTDAAIEGAVARLMSFDRVLQLKSRSDGSLPFTHVMPGTYDLEVSARGFITKKLRDVQVPRPADKPLAVTLYVSNLPDHCGPLNLVDYSDSKSQSASISGHVIEADKDKPIAKAQINLSKSGDTHLLTNTRSGKKGEFTFEGIPPGRYSVYVKREAYWPSDIKGFFAPRENSTTLTIFLDKTNHIRICQ
jgi:5-hydroxyisourate hydrolase-like protein (transthyretin family)